MLRGRSLGQAIGVVALLCATVGVSTASAQVDYEIMSSLQFNFSNPGARSLAMAGALTGAGDDATGAWTNPGGLTNITRPEVGVEFRAFNFETPFVFGGRFNGTPTQRGIDTVNGLTQGSSDQQTHSLSFVSAVVPKSRFAFAFYRTEVANFETDVTTSGPFYDQPTGAACSVARPDRCSRIFPVDGYLDLKISNFGGSAAVRLADQVSVGVGVSFYDFEIDSTNRRFGLVPNSGTGTGEFFGAPSYTVPGNVNSVEFINGEDTALGVNVGASINPSDKFRIGASYRQGPKFDLAYRRERSDGTRICLDGGSTCAPGASTFKVPDVIGVGVLIKPAAALNVTVDFRRIQYSQVTKDMEAGFAGVDAADYGIDDGNEFRAAGEYLFTNLPSPISAIAIRGGFWHDPDHRIRYTGDFSPDTVLFPAGEDEEHVTFGGGVVFDKVQFDLGFDRSETVKTFSVSAVLRF
jgi:long-chain fatty acid transport protein